ncbi:hypothetical protein GCM10025864_12440 [Luteimicrobium album]|uniref:Uncharacterized protein n=1 Tax=Luteimicrobium album TaxID=1054550 RepID=A0ABQ6HYA7_9MICO|nr:hypothetical protein [Luteimicrobium album]GMA23485.1 hypothetical protein GCM10025864_12440 [Luteimicrobium album]
MPEQPVSPGAPAPDDVPSPGVDLAAAAFPGLAQVAGAAAGDTPFLVVAGDDDAGVCVDGVCALPSGSTDAGPDSGAPSDD